MNAFKLILIGIFAPCYLSGQNANSNEKDLEIGIIEKLDSDIIQRFNST